MSDSDLRPIEIAAHDGTGHAAASAVANLRNVKGAVDQLSGAMGQVSGASESAAAGMESAFTKIAGRLAGGALVVGLVAALKGARDQLADLGDRADDLRLPAQYLAEMEIAAAQARVPLEKLTAAQQFFAEVSKKDAEDAEDFYTALGNISKASAEAFKSAGSQIERQKIVGDAYRSTADEVKRAQLGLEAYGSDNERLLGVVNAGTEGLAQYRAKALELGVVIDEAMIKKAQDAQSTMNVLSTVIRDRVNIGINELVQAAPGLIAQLKDLGGAFGIASGPASTFTDIIRGTKEELAKLQFFAEFAGAGLQHMFGFIDRGAADAARAAAVARYEMNALKNSTLAVAAGIEEDIGKSSDPLKITVRPAFKPRPELNPDKDNDEDAFSRAESQIRKRIALTDAETATIGLNTEARERAKVVAELEEAAKRANIAAGEKNTEVTDEQRRSIEKLADAMLLAAKRQREAKTAWDGLNETARYFGNVVVDAFDVAMDKTKSWADFTIASARNVAKELLRAAITGEGAFAKLFGMASSNGGTGGIFGMLLSGLSGFKGSGPGVSDATFSGFSLPGTNAAVAKFAGGGQIPAGGLALVSEHKNPRFLRAGDEPITVTPGEPVGGGRGYVDNRQFHFDASGADPAAISRLEMLIAKVKAGTRAEAISAVNEFAARGA